MMTYRPPRFRPAAAYTAFVLALAVFPSSARAQGSLIWDLTPTRIALSVGIDPACGLTTDEQQQFIDQIIAFANRIVGAAWQVEIVPCRHERLLYLMSTTAPKLHPPKTSSEEPPDKWIVLHLSQAEGRRTITAREYDGRVERWGSTMHGPRPGNRPLADVAFDVLLRAYRPLGQIEADGESALLRLRGAALPPRDPSLWWATSGDLFEVFVRFNQRDGSARAIRDVQWTLLEVVEDKPSAAQAITCRVHTALRDPLQRRRGRVELLALAAQYEPTPTRLRIISNDESARPLAGYGIYDVAGEEPERLGYSDVRGSLKIPPTERRLRLLWVTSGGQPLAPRLPLAVGAQSEVELRLPDDSARIEVVGTVQALQEELVDVIAKRRILMSMAEQRISAGSIEAAGPLIDDLLRLPTRSEFSVRVTALEQRLTTDQRSQRQLQQLLQETRKLVQDYLDPAPVRKLQSRWMQLQSQQASNEPTS